MRTRDYLGLDLIPDSQRHVFCHLQVRTIVSFTSDAFLQARFHNGGERGAPYLRKFGKLSTRENLVMTSPYVRTDSPGRGK